MTRDNNLTANRIIKAATYFFARKGYHATSIRDIAREAKISVATLYYYAKSKDDLYRLVFEDVYKQEIQVIMGVLSQADENTVLDPKELRKLLFKLMDDLIDRSSKNPDLVRLWAQRWLDKPEDSTYIDAEYSAPLYQMLEQLLVKARENGIISPDFQNLNLVTHSFTWLHYSYFSLGNLTYSVQVRDPQDPQQLEEFREYMRILFSRILRFSDQL